MTSSKLVALDVLDRFAVSSAATRSRTAADPRARRGRPARRPCRSRPPRSKFAQLALSRSGAAVEQVAVAGGVGDEEILAGAGVRAGRCRRCWAPRRRRLPHRRRRPLRRRRRHLRWLRRSDGLRRSPPSRITEVVGGKSEAVRVSLPPSPATRTESGGSSRVSESTGLPSAERVTCSEGPGRVGVAGDERLAVVAAGEIKGRWFTRLWGHLPGADRAWIAWASLLFGCR